MTQDSKHQPIPPLHANRKRGQTGPKSMPGKKRSAMNALKTGLYAKSKLLPFESEQKYRQHVRAIFDSLSPDNALESHLVQDIADSLWRGMRLDLRAGLYRDEILKQLTPQKLAELLGIQGRRRDHAPAMLVNPNHRISKKQLPHLQKCFDQYQQLIESEKTQPVSNYNLVWRKYPELFILLHEWLITQGRAPLLDEQYQTIKSAWQHGGHIIKETLQKLTDYVWYQLNFERLKPQIRHWIAVWYFLQVRDSRISKDIDDLMMRERRICHDLLDRYCKLRKSRLIHGIWQVHAMAEAEHMIQGLEYVALDQVDTTAKLS